MTQACEGFRISKTLLAEFQSSAELQRRERAGTRPERSGGPASFRAVVPRSGISDSLRGKGVSG